MPNDSILASHYQSPWLRQLPYYRTMWPGIEKSSNLFAGTNFLARRVTFLLVILMRTLVGCFYFVFLYVWDTSLQKLAPIILWYVAWFVPILWNLHLIVESTKPRDVLGWTVPGAVITICLWLLLPVHLVFAFDNIMALSSGIYQAAIRCVFYLAIVATISWVAGGEED
jgi:hypothetical protein